MTGVRGPSSMEVSNNWYPSSNAYLSVRFEGKTSKLRILNKHHCDHVSNICELCAETWSWDYELLFDNTIGGRKLKERIDGRQDQAHS